MDIFIHGPLPKTRGSVSAVNPKADHLASRGLHDARETFPLGVLSRECGNGGRGITTLCGVALM